MRQDRGQRGLDAQRLGGAGQAIGDGGEHQVLANLASTRCPADEAGLWVERRPIGQADGRVGQRGAEVRVGAMDGELQLVAQLHRVVGHLQCWSAVDVGYRQLHRGLALCARRIDRRKTQRVVAGLFEARFPAELAGARVEARTRWQRG